MFLSITLVCNTEASARRAQHQVFVGEKLDENFNSQFQNPDGRSCFILSNEPQQQLRRDPCWAQGHVRETTDNCNTEATQHNRSPLRHLACLLAECNQFACLVPVFLFMFTLFCKARPLQVLSRIHIMVDIRIAGGQISIRLFPFAFVSSHDTTTTVA